MFTSITWQQYLLAIATLGTVYYSIILLICYRDELGSIFNFRTRKQATAKPSPQNLPGILGEINQDTDSTLILSEDLQFSETPNENED